LIKKNCGIIFTKRVYIASQDGDAYQTFIKCGTNDPIFTIAAGLNATIEKLTLSNAIGPGIILLQKATLTLIKSHITDCEGDQGGAISMFEDSFLQVEACIFSQNSARNGAVVYARKRSRLVNKGNTELHGNIAKESGGAFYLDQVDIHWPQGLVNNNKAGKNGGAFYIETSIVNLYELMIAENKATELGGAFFISGQTVANFEDVNIGENVAEMQGGAIYCQGGSTILLNECSVYSNKVDNVFCFEKKCRIKDTKHSPCTCDKCE